LLKAFKSQDVVISTTPAHSTQTEISFIDAAVKAGVKRFTLSEFGSNSRNAKGVEIFPFMASKVKVVDYPKSKEETGLTWTALATGTFFDHSTHKSHSCLSVGFYGHDVAKHQATIWDSGDVKFSTTTRTMIGKAFVAVLDNPVETANQYLYVSSFQITMNEFVASLKKVPELTSGTSSMSKGKSGYSWVENCWCRERYGSGWGSWPWPQM
jgi:hypothetical protein